MTGTLAPDGDGLASAAAPGAYGFRRASAVVVFPVVHSADQSGSPPLTGTMPGGVYRGTALVWYGWMYFARIM